MPFLQRKQSSANQTGKYRTLGSKEKKGGNDGTFAVTFLRVARIQHVGFCARPRNSWAVLPRETVPWFFPNTEPFSLGGWRLYSPGLQAPVPQVHFKSFWGRLRRLWNGVHSVAHRPQRRLSVQSLRPRRWPTGVESLERPPNGSLHVGASRYAVAFSLPTRDRVSGRGYPCARRRADSHVCRQYNLHGWPQRATRPIQITAWEFWDVFIGSCLQSPKIVPAGLLASPESKDFKCCDRILIKKKNKKKKRFSKPPMTIHMVVLWFEIGLSCITILKYSDSFVNWLLIRLG